MFPMQFIALKTYPVSYSKFEIIIRVDLVFSSFNFSGQFTVLSYKVINTKLLGASLNLIALLVNQDIPNLIGDITKGFWIHFLGFNFDGSVTELHKELLNMRQYGYLNDAKLRITHISINLKYYPQYNI
ncbi:unnamed protein product [Paramecium sonneborni]|uniref:Uncharacterized protein n=1 Tax=Paramecium sonneborni TaxID=65129 RepID=A0A8S1PV85_9CILI|nr:unnamed protein product [Paramecium sonneborni]